MEEYLGTALISSEIVAVNPPLMVIGKICFVVCIMLIIVININIKRYADLKDKNINNQTEAINKKLKRIKIWSIIFGILFIILASISGLASYIYYY